MIQHRRRHVFWRKVHVGATTLELPAPHESCFVRGFIGIGASHGSEDLIEAFGCNPQDARLENGRPVVLGEVAKGRAIDQRGSHFRRGRREEKGRVVVADRNGGNLSIDVEKDVAIEVRKVVAIALLIICHHVQAAHVEHSVKVGDSFLALRAWNRSPDLRSGGLVGEEGCIERRVVMWNLSSGSYCARL